MHAISWLLNFSANAFISFQARIVLGVATGALVGEYLALEVVPAQALLQVGSQGLRFRSCLYCTAFIVVQMWQPAALIVCMLDAGDQFRQHTMI